MAGDASNNGYCSPKFVAYVIRNADNGVRRTYSKRVASGVVGPAFGLRHLPVDVGLLSPGRRIRAHRLFGQAPASGTLTLFHRALAFVRAPLPLVCLTLAIVRDSVSLVGEPISSTRQPLAPSDFGLALVKRLLALIERLGLAFEFSGCFGAVPNGHELNHNAAGDPAHGCSVRMGRHCLTPSAQSLSSHRI